MKALTSKLLMIILVLLMVLSLAGCGRDSDTFQPDLSDLPEIENVDFAEEIDNYAEDEFNVIDLKSGDKEKLHKADTYLFFGGACYSSDESVATISDKGVVTAKNKGACYVMIVSNSFAPEVYKIMVDAPKEITLFNVMSIVVPVFMVGILIAVIVANRTRKPKIPQFTAPQNEPPMYNGYGSVPTGESNYVNQQPANAKKVCPQCGQTAEGAFCPYCGSKLN